MNELGFGILDRRTIIVTLLTIVIVNMLFQFDLPIRVDNAGDFFIDLILFTGYLYLARSIFRLLALLFIFLVRMPSDRIHDFKWSKRINEMIEKENISKFSKLKVFVYKTIYVFAYFIKSVFFTITMVPFVVFFSSDYEEEIKYLESVNGTARRAALFRFFERVSLIAIVTFATIPNYTTTSKHVGVFGLTIMIIIYIFKGDFTFFIKDKIAEDIEKKTSKNKLILKEDIQRRSQGGVGSDKP